MAQTTTRERAPKPAQKPRKDAASADIVRRVAVVGGNRIPFARSNTVYAGVSNQDMLTAALDGLVGRYGLEGERVGEVVAGAVLKQIGRASCRERV